MIFAASTTTQSAHDFSFASIDGEILPLANFKGKAVLIVNTASMCGFTSQYSGLQDLWDSYRDRGLVVLGVPSDDFGGQELDSAAEVKSFCTINFDIDFPMTDIVRVKGPLAHPYTSGWPKYMADWLCRAGIFINILLMPMAILSIGLCRPPARHHQNCDEQLKKSSPEHIQQNEHARFYLQHHDNSTVAFATNLPSIPPIIVQICNTHFFLSTKFF